MSYFSLIVLKLKIMILSLILTHPRLPFLSLKCPDFRNVILKILEVSSCDPPATVHSRSAQIKADRPCAVAGELQEDTSHFKDYIFEIRVLQGSK